MNLLPLVLPLVALLDQATAAEPWRQYAGQPGPDGWRCHVVQPDPDDDGPDGINIHDWDGDGDLDLFVNYEEGRYSRLFFNPGKDAVRGRWDDFVEFKHGKCEDSGIGDLDDDVHRPHAGLIGGLALRNDRDQHARAVEALELLADLTPA